MKKTVKTIVEKYNLTEKRNEINKLENETVPLHIGFLGEFSSGKSTLINALIGKKILPAMDRPTSKSIVEVHPKKGLEKTEYYEIKDNIIEKIMPVEFQDISNGKRDGKAMLFVPENKYFQEGWVFVDTPGLASLDQTDTDITYEYLPTLDSAVICLDIAHGSLTKSILDFLSKKEVRPFVHNFIFAITHADIKNIEQHNKIKDNIVKQVEIFCKEHKIPVKNETERVVLVSAKNALDQNDKPNIDEFIQTLETQILSQKQLIQKERVYKEFLIITEDLAILLEDRLENLSLDNTELEEKQTSLKKDSKNLNKKIEKNKELLQRAKIDLQNELLQIAESTSALYQAETTNEGISFVSNNFVMECKDVIARSIKKYFEDTSLTDTHINCVALESQLKNIIKINEFSKTVVTAIAFAAISGGASVAANAGEAGGAVAVRTIAKRTVIEGAKGVGKQVLKKRILLGLTALARGFQNINPVEHIGNYISGRVIENKALNHLQNIAVNTAEDVYVNLQYEIENNIITPIEIKIEEIQESIDVIRTEKNEKRQDLSLEKTNFKKDITSLKTILIQES